MTERAQPTPSLWVVGEQGSINGPVLVVIDRESGLSKALIPSPADRRVNEPSEDERRTAHLIAAAPETAAERDRLKAELSNIDGILARRPALDAEPDRASKILMAVYVASQRDRLKVVNAELFESLRVNCIWLRAALRFEQWDSDQRTAADQCLAEAHTLLDKHVTAEEPTP